MTKTIIVTLINAASGTWIAKLPARFNLGTGESTPACTATVADGVLIPENRDGWAVASALEPCILAVFGSETDTWIECYDSTAIDIGGMSTTDPVCQFHIRNGKIVDTQVPRPLKDL
jgi:hypothetical protein